MVNRNYQTHIIDVYLDKFGCDVREQIRRETCDLDPGTKVRIWTGWAMPPIWGIIIPNYLDQYWFRSDLTYIWEHSSDAQARKWELYTDHYKGGK
jgi:hypothetical protein